ncbi:hypothetical protein OYC64_012917 [Pagothenia borchgrevinki]|uniref:Uncharacterized protein n=1 Tax=Pagothenia borchgrevinki TaxID=8213 RepID=A0ABD2FRW7_PAGBO
MTPPYLSELLHPYTPNRPLRSADQLLLNVPRTKSKLRGGRCFSVAAPTLWNDLPLHIRQAPTLWNDLPLHIRQAPTLWNDLPLHIRQAPTLWNDLPLHIRQAPTLWNDLPLHIRQAATLPVFKSLLKTHLFSLAY